MDSQKPNRSYRNPNLSSLDISFFDEPATGPGVVEDVVVIWTTPAATAFSWADFFSFSSAALASWTSASPRAISVGGLRSIVCRSRVLERMGKVKGGRADRRKYARMHVHF